MKGIENLVVKKRLDTGRDLVGEVAADHALAGVHVIRLANAGEQQQLHIEHLEGAEEDHLGRLLPLAALRVDISDAGRPLAGIVEIDPRNLAFGARLEVRSPHQHRQERYLRARLRVIAAAEPLAEAAKGARPKRDAERVGVGLGQIAGGLRKRAVAHLFRRLGPQHRPIGLLLGRRRIGARPRSLERIAKRLLLPLQVPGGSRRAAQMFECIEMRLELVVGDAPVLDRHVRGQEFRAVTLGQVRFQYEIGRQKAPGLRVPVQARATDAIGHQKRAPGADRQRRLPRIIAKGERRLSRPHEQIVPHRIAQLVRRITRGKVGRGVAPWPALDRDHIEARFGHRTRR